jgi:iron complex outermembrane receptor protein
VKFSTGKLNNHFELSGRLSQINSDGYVDRAFSDLKSYFIQGAYVSETSLIKAITFGGHERTYQAWDGLTIEELEEDRTQNPYEYENEIDNYKQDHYQLHWNEKWSTYWSSNIGLNYTYGRGYFEQYREDDDVNTYSGIVIPDVDGEDTTDLIRRRWLDNDFYVINASANYRKNEVNLQFGASLSDYDGDHYGEVIWARSLSENAAIRDRYYEGNGRKKEFSLFAKSTYRLNDALTLFGDLQLRNVSYKTKGITSDLINMKIDENYNFFNPKAGVSYQLNDNNNFYFSYARGNREPSRSDFENNPNIKPEQLNDFELGWRLKNSGFGLSTNIYYMHYNEQLVMTGAIDDVGAPVRDNSGESYRLGLEVAADITLLKDLLYLQPNLTLSSNKNKEVFYEYDGALTNFGETKLAFSPSLVSAANIIYNPAKNLSISFLQKYVGEQYMGNIDSKGSKLDAYYVADLNINYELKLKSFFNSIVFSALVNNIFDSEYVSNGYWYTYDDNWSDPNVITTIEGAGYYPQATRNFLVGVTIKF